MDANHLLTKAGIGKDSKTNDVEVSCVCTAQSQAYDPLI